MKVSFTKTSVLFAAFTTLVVVNAADTGTDSSVHLRGGNDGVVGRDLNDLDEDVCVPVPFSFELFSKSPGAPDPDSPACFSAVDRRGLRDSTVYLRVHNCYEEESTGFLGNWVNWMKVEYPEDPYTMMCYETSFTRFGYNLGGGIGFITTACVDEDLENNNNKIAYVWVFLQDELYYPTADALPGDHCDSAVCTWPTDARPTNVVYYKWKITCPVECP